MEFEIVDKKIKIDENKNINIKLINDHFENAKRYQIPHAQLIIADIPYNLGNKALLLTLNGMLMVIIKMVNQN